jgi:hypothetical protein
MDSSRCLQHPPCRLSYITSAHDKESMNTRIINQYLPLEYQPERMLVDQVLLVDWIEMGRDIAASRAVVVSSRVP